jgi:hypothetical protein
MCPEGYLHASPARCASGPALRLRGSARGLEPPPHAHGHHERQPEQIADGEAEGHGSAEFVHQFFIASESHILDRRFPRQLRLFPGR